MTGEKKKAAVFVRLGQSNAVGHGIPMDEKDKIKEPQKNVFGLSRTANQSYDNNELFWSGYTSFDMNLGEEQDDTYSVANCLAIEWQKELDKGEKLPDLYIVHIAIGAQGVTKNYMWYPDREKKLVPGVLGVADISLYSFTEHILSLALDSFEKMGIAADFIGVHWRGGEQDTLVLKEELEPVLKEIYEKIFSGLSDALGEEIPVVLPRITHAQRSLENDPEGKVLESFYYINEVFCELCDENENMQIFDVRKAPFYRSDERGNGILMEDIVHYTPKTNKWVAGEILKEYKKRNLN